MKKIIIMFLLCNAFGHDTPYKHSHQYPRFIRQQEEWLKSIEKHNSFQNSESYRYWRSKYEEVMKDMNELHIHYNKLNQDHNSLNQSYQDLRNENTKLRLMIKRYGK